jgi:hypothetical protein
MSCTKPNCDCAEKEMEAQGTECIKSYPCLGSSRMVEELKRMTVQMNGGTATFTKQPTEEQIKLIQELMDRAKEQLK